MGGLFVDFEKEGSDRVGTAIRSEAAQNRKRDHPRPRLMDTSRVDGMPSRRHEMRRAGTRIVSRRSSGRHADRPIPERTRSEWEAKLKQQQHLYEMCEVISATAKTY